MHSRLDLNLIVALDALLDECSVTRAAERLRISEPAMSRTLGRIRRVIGDPILVRAGQTMQPTPRAEAIHAEVHSLVQRAYAVLAPVGELVLDTLTRTFTIVANDAIVTSVGNHLVASVETQAPGVTLRFLAELSSDGSRLREGTTDLEIGVIGDAAPEVRVEHLAEDHHVLVMRSDHPLAVGELTVECVAAARHIVTSRRGRLVGPLDDSLAVHGLSRRVSATAPTYAATLLLMMNLKDCVALVPWLHHRHTARALGLVTRELPVRLPRVRLSQAWHSRNDVDPAHAWLRAQVRDSFHAVISP